ncbi:MAG: hypothetical protein ABW189_05930 [Rickettsiales bacterium]
MPVHASRNHLQGSGPANVNFGVDDNTWMDAAVSIPIDPNNVIVPNWYQGDSSQQATQQPITIQMQAMQAEINKLRTKVSSLSQNNGHDDCALKLNALQRQVRENTIFNRKVKAVRYPMLALIDMKTMCLGSYPGGPVVETISCMKCILAIFPAYRQSDIVLSMQQSLTREISDCEKVHGIAKSIVEWIDNNASKGFNASWLALFHPNEQLVSVCLGCYLGKGKPLRDFSNDLAAEYACLSLVDTLPQGERITAQAELPEVIAAKHPTFDRNARDRQLALDRLIKAMEDAKKYLEASEPCLTSVGEGDQKNKKRRIGDEEERDNHSEGETNSSAASDSEEQ